MKELSEQQRYQIAYHLVEPELADMFVTPKNIDELVRRISFTISEAIMVLFSGRTHILINNKK